MVASGVGVEIDQVTKRYDRVVAVDEVTLQVRPGEFLSLLGPSGCGKTSLLRLIAGFLSPDAGSIAIGGRRMDGVPPYDRNLGMVFQSYGLFPHMTVAENIGFGLKMRGLPRRAAGQRITQALELVRLPGFEERYPKQLSGGQQQRVALARAIVYEPDVLLLDEPLGALDKKLREQMQIELKALQRTLGVTTIFVTHDQEEALTLSDRIAVMDRGQIEQLGTPADVYERPASTFVSDFIGLSNLLACRVVANGTAPILETEQGLRLAPPPGAPLPAVGSTVTVAIRPEKLEMVANGGDQAAGFGFAGVVTDTVYVGASTHYHVALPGGDRLVVARQNRSRDEGSAVAQIDRGAQVWVAWEPRDVVVLGERAPGE
jgi:spermidine/putrescine ABC transporter ATP-binding subunit